MLVAVRPSPSGDPRARPRRPTATEQHLLVGLHLLTAQTHKPQQDDRWNRVRAWWRPARTPVPDKILEARLVQRLPPYRSARARRLPLRATACRRAGPIVPDTIVPARLVLSNCLFGSGCARTLRSSTDPQRISDRRRTNSTAHRALARSDRFGRSASRSRGNGTILRLGTLIDRGRVGCLVDHRHHHDRERVIVSR